MKRCCLLLLILLISLSCTSPQVTVLGTWKFNKKKSTDLATWRYRVPQLVIAECDSTLEIVYKWTSRRAGTWIDSISVVPDGTPSEQIVETPHWPANWYMGVLAKTGVPRIISASWKTYPRSLQTRTVQTVEVSQGETEITTVCEYVVDRTGRELTVIERRSSRPTPVKMMFERFESKKLN